MKIDEILTVDILEQPSLTVMRQVIDHATLHYKDDLYYMNNNNDITVVRKQGDNILGYVIGIAYSNPLFTKIPMFVVPTNLYSWANDNGTTALLLIQSLISLSDIPVLSDIRMTPSSKKFMQKQIKNGIIIAKTFDLNNGTITPYESSIWNKDDDHRILLLKNPFGAKLNSESIIPIMEYSWNWLDRN